jgi:hypothetical protein
MTTVVLQGAADTPCGHCKHPIRGHRTRMVVRCSRCHKNLCNTCTGGECEKEKKQ